MKTKSTDAKWPNEQLLILKSSFRSGSMMNRRNLKNIGNPKFNFPLSQNKQKEQAFAQALHEENFQLDSNHWARKLCLVKYLKNMQSLLYNQKGSKAEALMPLITRGWWSLTTEMNRYRLR